MLREKEETKKEEEEQKEGVQLPGHDLRLLLPRQVAVQMESVTEITGTTRIGMGL